MPILLSQQHKMLLHIILCLVILSVFPQKAYSILNQEHSAPETNTENAVPWNLEADKVITLENNAIIEAEGNITLTNEDHILKADFIRYYSDTKWIFLQGNVSVTIDHDNINAEKAEFNLNSGEGWLVNGKIFLEDTHMYLSGSNVVKGIGNKYTLTDAKVTICDGPNPDWSLISDKAIIDFEKDTQLSHTKIKIKDLSVFYIPFLKLPTKIVQKSGFINPTYGISQKRGLYYMQPYYWSINQSNDLTLYGSIMTKVGPLAGVRYRSHPYSHQKSWIAATGIYDTTTITEPGTNPVYPSSPFLRTNSKRYWIRGMFDGLIANSTWKYTSNIDYVSDQDFLREFDQGITGFSKSRTELFNLFGRDINEDDQARLTAVMISNSWNRLGFTTSTSYNQNPSLGHGNNPKTDNTLVQKLPQVDFFLYQGPLIPKLPILFEASLQSAYMYRSQGTKGWRLESYPKISLPLDFTYITTRATLGLIDTHYITDTKSNSDLFYSHKASYTPPIQTGKSRTLISTSLEGYTQANRVWTLHDQKAISLESDNVGKNFLLALRHNVQPRIIYNFIPEKPQDKNPFYIEYDRLVALNEILFSIDNIFTKKNSYVAMSDNTKNAVPVHMISYEDTVRLDISSGYDFEETKRTIYLDLYPRRPIMDLSTNLEARIFSWLWYKDKTFLSMYTGNVTRHDHTISIQSSPMFTWDTGLSFRDPLYNFTKKIRYFEDDKYITQRVRLLQNTISIQLFHHWKITLEDSRNLDETGNFFTRTNGQLFEVSYINQCYIITARYHYDGYDQNYTILFEIPGLF